MRFLLFIGAFFLVGGATADVPGLPTVPAAPAAGQWFETQPEAECQAPTDVPDLQQASRGPFSMSLTATSGGEQDAFYKDLSVASTTTAENGKPTVILQQSDAHSMHLEAGADMQVGIPEAPMNLAFVIRNRTQVAASFPGDTSSERLWGERPFIDNSATNGNTMLGNGQALTEAGLTLKQAFGTGGNPFNVNAAFTARRQDVYQYDVLVEQGVSMLYPYAYGLNGEQGFNLDAGVTKNIRGVALAVNVANLFPRGMAPDAGIYGLKTSASVATTVDCGFSTAQLNLDWNARDGMGTTPSQRYATARMAFTGSQTGNPRLEWHLGYRRDLIDNLSSTASLGVDFAPSRVLNLDLSGTRAQSGAYGVMAEVGLKLR